MKDLYLLDINKRHLGAICLCVIVIILVAGLSPKSFHTKNDVTLLPDGKGVRFSGRGILFSSSPLIHRPDGLTRGSLTIEMAIQADQEWRSSLPVILEIDDGQPCARLLIGQWKNHLIIRSRRTACFQPGEYAEISLVNALPAGKEQFITIASGKDGTTLSVNGARVKKNDTFSFLKQGEALSGRLILGNSSAGKHSWTGTLSALAFTDAGLSPEEVLRNYQSWRASGKLSGDGTMPLVLYHFNEQSGAIIKDHSGHGNDIVIPEFFTPLQRRMLALPWDDFQPTRKYIRDVSINILGFIPFGFYVAWYFSERGIGELKIVIMVLFLGVGLSLGIEIAQAYLPKRSSQVIDVVTNGIGTTIGIYLWHKFIVPRRGLS